MQVVIAEPGTCGLDTGCAAGLECDEEPVRLALAKLSWCASEGLFTQCSFLQLRYQRFLHSRFIDCCCRTRKRVNNPPSEVWRRWECFGGDGAGERRARVCTKVHVRRSVAGDRRTEGRAVVVDDSRRGPCRGFTATMQDATLQGRQTGASRMDVACHSTSLAGHLFSHLF